MTAGSITDHKLSCFHCGEKCHTGDIYLHDKHFCCEGCKLVYQVLSSNELCGYYNLNEHPGISRKINVRQDKFAFLDDPDIQLRLISFKDESQVHANFYLPQVHCSSCLYLLENLHKLETGIISSKVNFVRKEVTVIFSTSHVKLRGVVELLTGVGYEPYISLNDLKGKRPAVNKTMIYQLGIAGFCFGNIMLMSFPEYLGIDNSEAALRYTFRWINFALAIPVLLYAALPFYQSSWKSIQHKFLNIDTPIALAIIITFIRSSFELISGTGSGYFDSMTGIVFFMLAGRVVQDKTYQQLSFERDYTAYFPLAVTVLKDNAETSTMLPNIKPGDTLLIHQEEILPVDGILTKGKALIDYSFVTGESIPVIKEAGELIYAGGKQTGGNMELLVIKEVAQSYLTSLWNKDVLKEEKLSTPSFIHVLSKYFTWLVLGIATVTGIYWQINEVVKVWPAVTAIFIIACPCALLLSSTFTNGNIMRIFGRNSFYLRNAETIESIAAVSHIVFDKTGTLTSAHQQDVRYDGKLLTDLEKKQVAALVACSNHPLSKALVKQLPAAKGIQVSGFKEIAGEGIVGFVENSLVKIGSARFVKAADDAGQGTVVYISFENKVYGYFRFSNHYRSAIPLLIQQLKKNYRLSVLSGDNDTEKNNLSRLFGETTALLFHQQPEDKLNYIQRLQKQGEKVMMIGDGLNDAGALKQSDVGIALSEDNNNFTPASDVIMDAKQLKNLTKFISLCKANRFIILGSFFLSVTYNIVGLFFAVQGNLSPVIAAILMPCSSLSILLVTFGSSNMLAKRLNLS